MGNTVNTTIRLEGEREYKNSIKNITQETKTLDAKLKEVASRFDDETEAMEKAQESAELLQKKKEALERELETMRSRLDDVTSAYGEGSTEALKLEQQIANVETQLNNTNGALEENQAVLDGVADSASDTSDEIGGIGSAADIANQMFGSSMSGMMTAITANNVFEGIQGVVDLVMEIGEAALEASEQYQQAMAIIAGGTGLTGDDLGEFQAASERLWASFQDADLTLEDTSSLVAALNTRFGIGTDQVQEWGTAVLEYSKITGEDATKSINDIADVMRSWGQETNNSAESLENARAIMDMLVTSGELCDASLSSLTGVLNDQAGAAQGLGMTMEDVIGFMVAYEDAGGDASTVGTTLKTAYEKLKDSVATYNEENVNAQTTIEDAWSEIMSTLEDGNDITEVLNTTVGDLGITIDDVMGRGAQKIVQGFTTGGASVEDFTGKIRGARGEVDALISSMITASDKASTFGRGAQNFFFGYNPASDYKVDGEGAFAKAMNQPYLFQGEQSITVGEAGPEVLVGQAYFDNLVARAQGNTTNNYNNTPTINVYGAPGQDVNDLARAIEQRLAVSTSRRAAW